jgi:hypothetical protein
VIPYEAFSLPKLAIYRIHPAILTPVSRLLDTPSPKIGEGEGPLRVPKEALKQGWGVRKISKLLQKLLNSNYFLPNSEIY